MEEMDFLDRGIKDEVKDMDEKEELLAVTWCLDNLIPLKYKSDIDVVTTYEDLLLDGESEVEKILEKLDIQEGFEKAKTKLTKPSEKTSRKEMDEVMERKKQLSRWKESLSEEQIEDIIDVLKLFKMDIYNENLKPQKDMK